ncbi:2-aminoadipate transaminase [compost metagenome]
MYTLKMLEWAVQVCSPLQGKQYVGVINMQSVIKLDHDVDKPLIQQIVDEITQAVAEKRLRAGSRLPSIRAFATAHRVSTFTVVGAYDRLVAQGVVDARRGMGFFVKEQWSGPIPQSALTVDDSITKGWQVRNVMQSGAGIIQPGAGWLPLAWHDGEDMARALRQIAAKPNELLGYVDAKGYEPLREQIVRQLAEYEIETKVSGVMTTLGVNQSLDLIIRHYIKPGDVVVVDEPGYSDLLFALRLRGIECIGVQMTATGPDVAQFEEILRTRSPKIFFTNSRLHNPTGASYSAATAFKVLRAAERYGCLIVEDDVSAGFVQGTHVTLAAMDQLKRVIYVGSFSKIMGAGLRVGFVVAQPEVIEGLLYQKLLSGMPPSVTEHLVSKTLAEGRLRKQTERLRKRLTVAQERVSRRLEEAGFQLFHKPHGGMFVWARPKIGNLDSNELAESGKAQKILLAPGNLFYAEKIRTSWMRLNVAHCSYDRLFKFLASSIR